MPDPADTKLTWPALLGRWMQFAQSALALPDDAEGRAWKGSVPAIIGLQAIALALQHLDELEADERALGIDRARVGIERYTDDLHAAWGDAELPKKVDELIMDAWSAVKQAEAVDRCGD